MYNFLDAIGAVIYIVFSLATFPLWLLVHFLIWIFLGARYAKSYRKSFVLKPKKKRVPYIYKPDMDLAFER